MFPSKAQLLSLLSTLGGEDVLLTITRKVIIPGHILLYVVTDTPFILSTHVGKTMGYRLVDIQEILQNR